MGLLLALTVARCFLMTDPLVEALCEGARPLAWVVSVNPLLDKLAVSLVASQQMVTSGPVCLQATATTSQEVQASLVDTCPPAMAQCTMDSPPQSSVQGTPPQMGQPIVVGTEVPGEDGEV